MAQQVIAETYAVRALRAVSRLGGVIPGWFPLVADPLFSAVHGRRGIVQVRHAGATIDLDLADYLQRKLYLWSFERRELRFIDRWLARGDIAVDVGANVGVLSMAMAAKVGPVGSVLAIEPLDRNARTLRRWCDDNGVSWVEVLEAAASTAEGSVALGLPEVPAGFASTGHYSSAHGGERIEVRTVALDEAVDARFPGRTVRLLKIDVEGMEADVLLGASRLLEERRVDAVMFEMNVDSPDPSAAARVLRSHGYRLLRLGVAGRLGGAAHFRQRPARKGYLARNLIAVKPDLRVES